MREEAQINQNILKMCENIESYHIPIITFHTHLCPLLNNPQYFQHSLQRIELSLSFDIGKPKEVQFIEEFFDEIALLPKLRFLTLLFRWENTWKIKQFPTLSLLSDPRISQLRKEGQFNMIFPSLRILILKALRITHNMTEEVAESLCKNLRICDDFYDFFLKKTNCLQAFMCTGKRCPTSFCARQRSLRMHRLWNGQIGKDLSSISRKYTSANGNNLFGQIYPKNWFFRRCGNPKRPKNQIRGPKSV